MVIIFILEGQVLKLIVDPKLLATQLLSALSFYQFNNFLSSSHKESSFINYSTLENLIKDIKELRRLRNDTGDRFEKFFTNPATFFKGLITNKTLRVYLSNKGFFDKTKETYKHLEVVKGAEQFLEVTMAARDTSPNEPFRYDPVVVFHVSQDGR